MRKNVLIRIGAAILMAWIAGAVGSWCLIDPVDSLVGARLGGRAGLALFSVEPNDLRETADLLSKSTIWGIRPDGAVLTPSSAKTVAEKAITWRVLAAVANKEDRYLLVQIDKKAPEKAKEGELLPDGSLIKEVSPRMYTVLTSDEEQKTIHLNFR